MSCAHSFGKWCPECVDGLVRAYNKLRAERPTREQVEALIAQWMDEALHNQSRSERLTIRACAVQLRDLFPAAGQAQQEPSDTRRDCTCLGTCKGPDGLGPRWRCVLGRSPAPPADVSPVAEDK